MSAKRAERQRRALPVELVELRAARDGGAPGVLATLTGYAAVFDRWSEPLFGFRERIAPGAFRKTILEGDIRALWNHDDRIVLGRNRAGTLRLAEDERGLQTEIDLPDNEWGRPVLDAVERGDVTGMSFAFDVIKESWVWARDSAGLDERTLHEVRLFDVSPVTFPAYPDTTVDIRSALADAGIDLAVIARLLARGRAGLPPRPGDGPAAQAAIEALRRALPAEPAPAGDHSAAPTVDEPAPPGGHSLDRARARLRLALADD